MSKSALAIKESAVVARPLKTLKPVIASIYEEMEVAAEEIKRPYYAQLGDALRESKVACHAEGRVFYEWIEGNCPFSVRTAQEYMKYARNIEFLEARSQVQQNETDGKRNRCAPSQAIDYPTLSQSLGKTGQSSFVEPVRQVINRVDVDRLRADNLSEQRENKAIRDVALLVVEAGYKAIAAKFHPDKGGSDVAMSRLNEVRAELRKFINSKW